MPGQSNSFLVEQKLLKRSFVKEDLSSVHTRKRIIALEGNNVYACFPETISTALEGSGILKAYFDK